MHTIQGYGNLDVDERYLGGIIMEQITLKVEGMSCGNCVKAIETNVGELAGVNNVAVSLDDKEVQVDFDPSEASVNKIEEEIEDSGFDLVK